MTNTPKAFDFGEEEDPAPPARGGPPKALSFDDLPPVPEDAHVTAKAAPAPLFDSDDHPAVGDALVFAQSDFPQLHAQAQQRMAALFRRLLPVHLAMVTQWAEAPLREQAALLQPITELVLAFTRMGVPAQLEAALESGKAPEGMFGKLFRRQVPLAQHKTLLSSSREALLRLLEDSELATRKLEESAQNLGLHAAALAVVAKLAGGAMDATLADAITQRRTLIGQAARQAELAIMQMGQVRQQAADLIGQISSFLTVTLPALEMAQAQGGN